MKNVYVMKCGCELSKGQLIPHQGKYMCPDHRQSIKLIVRTCKTAGCGKEMKLTTRQQSKVYCDECAKERKQRAKNSYKDRVKNAEIKLESSAKVEQAADRGDCLHRKECLSEAIKSNADFVDCINCPRYISEFQL